MTDSSSNKTVPGRTSPVMIILSTIGTIALISMLLFFAGIYMVIKGVVNPRTTVLSDSTEEKIGVVQINGVITQSEKFIDNLEEMRRNDAVKAVVVRIDSPGGAVGASQEIYQALTQLDAAKPVVASLGSVAASGGYYAALGARTIVANPGTVTASIGVIMKIPNLQKLMEKVGIATTVIKSGKLKDLGSISRELTPEEKAVLENVMDDIHNQFISDVASRRHLTETKVREIADGRILSGRQARDLGLVDELGNIRTAADIAAKEAGIQGEYRLLYPEQDRFRILKQMLEEGGAGAIARGIREALVRSGMDLISVQ